MTDETKLLVKALRTRCADVGDCNECPKARYCLHNGDWKMCNEAADLIESLAAELEQVRQKRNSLNMRLIDADALEKEYRRQFESVYKNVRDAVIPQDYYIERKAAYDKEIVRRDMEAFCKFLQSRPTIDTDPVRHGQWIHDINNRYGCSECMARETMSHRLMKKFCPNCGAKMDLED